MLSQLIIVGALFCAPTFAVQPLEAAQSVDAPKPPANLTEVERQALDREHSVRGQVEAALKLADGRLTEALKLAEGDQSKAAAEQLAVHAALIIYADAATRLLPDAQRKDRNHCLKRIEQTIFKQNRPLEAALRGLSAAEHDALQPSIDEIKKIRLRAVNDFLGEGKMLSQ